MNGTICKVNSDAISFLMFTTGILILYRVICLNTIHSGYKICKKIASPQMDLNWVTDGLT